MDDECTQAVSVNALPHLHGTRLDVHVTDGQRGDVLEARRHGGRRLDTVIVRGQVGAGG